MRSKRPRRVRASGAKGNVWGFLRQMLGKFVVLPAKRGENTNVMCLKWARHHFALLSRLGLMLTISSLVLIPVNLKRSPLKLCRSTCENPVNLAFFPLRKKKLSPVTDGRMMLAGQLFWLLPERWRKLIIKSDGVWGMEITMKAWLLIMSLSGLALAGSATAASYNDASPAALSAAKTHVGQLDKAMKDSVSVLKAGELKALQEHSRRFKDLVTAGKAEFGDSIFEPLGRCYTAGIHAQSWWSTQLSAARKGGDELASENIKSALTAYQKDRAQCLLDADPAQAKPKNECLISYGVDPETKKVVALPRPAHCK